MRLAEPIETTGFFWLPEAPDTRLPGVLRISEASEITVELAGVLGNSPSVFSPIGVTVTPHSDDEEHGLERIVGMVEKGGRITLDRCIRQGGRLGLPGGLFKSTVHASLAFIGVEYEKQEQVLFSEFSFSVDGLDAWLSISGIETEQDFENNSGFIRYHLPNGVALTLPDGVELEFAFNLTFPDVVMPATAAAVKQTASVHVKSKQPQPVEYFSRLAFKLCNFLSLALDQDVCIQSMTGYLDHETDEEAKRRHPVQIYGQFAPWTERRPNIRWYRALFRYPEVADQIGDLVTKWFENYDTFTPALNLYFASRTQTQVFLDAKVLWLAQALETLHRRSSQETEMSGQDFTNLLDLVTQSAPSDRQKWVRDNLQYANELRFRRRIRRLLEPFASWFGSSGARRAFISRVCDTRNYLTHYDEETTKNRAVQPEELFALHEKMEVLFQLHLLSLIGFDHSSIGSLVQRNARLRRKLDG